MSDVLQEASESPLSDDLLYPVEFNTPDFESQDKNKKLPCRLPDSSVPLFTEEDGMGRFDPRITADAVANGVSDILKVSVADILEQGNYSPSHYNYKIFSNDRVHDRDQVMMQQRPRSHSHDRLLSESKATDIRGDGYYGTLPKTIPVGSGPQSRRSYTQAVLPDVYKTKLKTKPRNRSSFLAMTHTTISDELQEENAFFSMSHALMTVLEEYIVFVDEQQLGLDSYDPGSPGEDVMPMQPHNVEEYAETNAEFGVRESAPMSPPLYSENSCLLLFDPQIYQAGAHRCAHKLLSALSRSLNKDVHFTTDSDNHNLCLPGTLQSLLLKSKEISDSLEEIRIRHAQRGTCEWAPPRQQVLFQIEPFKELKKQMLLQEYRCAGCRMEVEQSLAKHYRYCYYQGKYFCQNCHSNKKAILPALVIHEWSFKHKPVSNIAHDLLMKIEDIPHYNISELNKDLYKRVTSLSTMKVLRQQLVSARQYIKTCRLATDLAARYEELGHLATDCHVYSLNDLVRLEKGELLLQARVILEASFKHVKECEICKYKGHYCEICQRDGDIIYPFEAKRVVQCQQCFACYHKECFMQGSVSCPKCVRLRAWKSRSDLS